MKNDIEEKVFRVLNSLAVLLFPSLPFLTLPSTPSLLFLFFLTISHSSQFLPSPLPHTILLLLFPFLKLSFFFRLLIPNSSLSSSNFVSSLFLTHSFLSISLLHSLLLSLFFLSCPHTSLPLLLPLISLPLLLFLFIKFFLSLS